MKTRPSVACLPSERQGVSAVSVVVVAYRRRDWALERGAIEPPRLTRAKIVTLMN